MSTTYAVSYLDPLLEAIRADYREMPGMRLSPAQFRRLWNLDERLYRQVTGILVAEGFLRMDHRRRFYWTAPARP